MAPLDLELAINVILVLLGHDVLEVRDLPSLIDRLLSDLPQDLHERRDLYLLSFLGRLNPHDREGETLDVEECISYEVLLLIYEALPQLLDDLLLLVSLVQQLNELSRCDLPLPDNALLVLHDLGLMVVDEGIVLADLAHHVVDLLISGQEEEDLFNVEVLLLNTTGDRKVVITLVGYEKELLDKSRGRGQTNEL